jgi:hypothetical protein
VRHFRIEDSPQQLAQFKKLIADHKYRDAFIVLGECTIEQATVEALGSDAVREVRIYAESYEAQLNRKILLPTIQRLPPLRGHARATYQLRHHDLMDEHPRALNVLERFQVRATRHDITADLAEWADEQRRDPMRSALIDTHFDLSTKENS